MNKYQNEHDNFQEYIPGKCNIGEEERKLRRRTGYIALAVAIIFLFFLYSINANHFIRILLFLPIFLSVISFMQDRLHFCAEFGILGIYNFGEVFSRVSHPRKSSYEVIDKRKSLQIIFYSFLIALLITLLIFILP